MSNLVPAGSSSRDAWPPITAISTARDPSEYDEDDDDEGEEYDDDGDSTDKNLSSSKSSIFASGPIGAPSAVPVAPKPKRTRQLTTPHQAEVLHALLAQVSMLRHD